MTWNTSESSISGGQPGAPFCPVKQAKWNLGTRRAAPAPACWGHSQPPESGDPEGTQMVCCEFSWAEMIPRTAVPAYHKLVIWARVRPKPVLLPYLAHPVNTQSASSTGSMISRAGSGELPLATRLDTQRDKALPGRQQRLCLGICVWNRLHDTVADEKLRTGSLTCLTGTPVHSGVLRKTLNKRTSKV